MMSTITITTIEKNKPLLMYNAFNYTIDRTSDTKVYWKCQYSRTIKCKRRIHTDVNYTNILHEAATHNHSASAAHADIQDKIPSRAVNNNESTENCLRNVSDQMVARLPTFNDNKMIYLNFH